MSDAKTFSDKQRWIKNSRGETINLKGETRSPAVHSDSPKTVDTNRKSVTATKRVIEFQNIGTTDCYYGGSSVTKTNGIALFSAGEKITFENVATNFTIYFITASGSTTLRIVEY